VAISNLDGAALREQFSSVAEKTPERLNREPRVISPLITQLVLAVESSASIASRRGGTPRYNVARLIFTTWHVAFTLMLSSTGKCAPSCFSPVTNSFLNSSLGASCVRLRSAYIPLSQEFSYSNRLPTLYSRGFHPAILTLLAVIDRGTDALFTTHFFNFHAAIGFPKDR
jgi:hypothetical protein